jgi:hypothetical protein
MARRTNLVIDRSSEDSESVETGGFIPQSSSEETVSDWVVLQFFLGLIPSRVTLYRNSGEQWSCVVVRSVAPVVDPQN